MNLKSKNIVSVRDLSKEEIKTILQKAKEMEELLNSNKSLDTMRGKILANMFFEPSTRTKFSFASAMQKLGGQVLTLEDTESTSIVKGESLIDTIKMMEKYSDLIVIRHPREGSARLAAEVSSKPVINGGDGANQHPTQTLLDLYTIRRLKGKIEGLNVALIGDLKHGRVMKSLAYALARLDARLTLIAPIGMEMPQVIVEELIEKFDADIMRTTSITSGIKEADVAYVCRVQTERFEDVYEAEKMQRAFRITQDVLKHAKDELIILHALPKTTEIDPKIDETRYAKYYQQAFYGVPVRMAIISLLVK
ncbi:MAG: aspartate carbamoyltransferase [Candidatus Bathyarchaeota archaeon]|nr:MAG: aspartate carbamoyltransferase [Candidatus Bathyarchaeota archaeon]